MDQALKFVPLILTGTAAIGGFIYWHFKTLYGLKDEIHRIEIQVKDLDKKVALQKQTTDKLAELYPLLTKIFDMLQAKGQI